MQLEKVHAGVFFHPDLEALKKAFFKKFTVVLAAGGLVRNDAADILMILRKGKWDVPKGKLDKGEKLEHCAVREVQEETGLKKVKLEDPLLITHHTYHEGSRFILKESHWYQMLANGEQALVPQVEEDIKEIKWIDPEDLDTYIPKSFPSVVDVLNRYRAF